MRNTISSLLLTFILLFSAAGCKKDKTDVPPSDSIPIIEYKLLGTYPHDTNSFTEGLLFTRDTLFESTGSPPGLPHCRSVFGPVGFETGRIDVKADLGREGYFGEGIAYLDGKFYQLTYMDGVGFVYDAVTYGQIAQFTIPANEGWGLTTDGEALIMSDGTNKLTFFDPQNFQMTKIIYVTEMGSPKTGLNELEFIKGYIYANIWLGKKIVKIDPSNGKVVGAVDLTALANQAEKKYPGSLSMNGIAFDPGKDHLFITGKLWPEIYEIELQDTYR